MPTYVSIARLSDIPADRGLQVAYGEHRLAVFRIGDAVHVIDNVCPHRAGDLAEGDLSGTVVYCPLHAWAFDVRTGQAPNRPGICVRSFPARVENEDVQVE
ncbi:MAG: Rieske (2Fe-2S) protein, partial [Myxococcales bacterium]